MNTIRRVQHWKANLPPIFGVAFLGWLAIFYGSPPQTVQRGESAERLRLGYFPNITHAPAVVGMARGEFQKAVGREVTIEPKIFNDGPTAMEALLAGEIDISYVGPSPAINTFLKSKGRALRVLAGACIGGAALVARPAAGIASVRELDGKRVAVPQLGGTQDISLRHFLAKEGLRAQEKGGSVQIIPMKPADALPLLKSGEMDAAWVPEPWAARLIHQAKAHLVVDERDLWPNKRFPTTVVVARKAYLEKNPSRVQAILAAHLHSVAWLQKNPAEGQSVINKELKRLTGKSLPKAILSEAWTRVAFAPDLDLAGLESFAAMATSAGYLPSQSQKITDLIDSQPLENAQRRTASLAR